jgi:hypothetical protein
MIWRWQPCPRRLWPETAGMAAGMRFAAAMSDSNRIDLPAVPAVRREHHETLVPKSSVASEWPPSTGPLARLTPHIIVFE